MSLFKDIFRHLQKITHFSTKNKNDRNWVKNYMQVKQTLIFIWKFLKYLLNKEIIQRSNTICSKGRMCWTIWSFFPSSTWYLLPCRVPCLKCSHLCPNRICWKFTEPTKFPILISFFIIKIWAIGVELGGGEGEVPLADLLRGGKVPPEDLAIQTI